MTLVPMRVSEIHEFVPWKEVAGSVESRPLGRYLSLLKYAFKTEEENLTAPYLAMVSTDKPFHWSNTIHYSP